MNYYFKLSEPSDDDVIETDDYLEHAQHEGYYSPNLGKVNSTTVPTSGSAMYRLGKCYVTTDSYRGQESHYMHVVLTNLNRKQGTNIPDFVIPLDKYDNASSAVNDFLNNMQNWYPSFWSPIRQDFKSTLIKEAHRLWYNNSNKPQHAGYYSPNLSHSVTIDSAMCAVVPAGEELAHFGVIGMKWGVRRFQNKDGSLTEEGKKHYGVKSINDIDILKKGTELSTVRGITAREFLYNNGKNFTSSQLISLKNQQANNYGFKSMPLYTYETNNEHDEKVYKGPFSIYLQKRGQRFIQEYKFKVVDDLAMPKKEDRINEFKKLTTDKKFSSDTMKLLKDVQDQCIAKNIGGEKMVKDFKALDLNNIKTDKDWDTAYKLFNHAMEAALYYNSTKEYLRRMSSKYDAMVDDNNKDIYNNAQNPIIIFNAAKVLSDNGVKNVTMEEIDKYTEELRKEQGGKVLI